MQLIHGTQILLLLLHVCSMPFPLAMFFRFKRFSWKLLISQLMLQKFFAACYETCSQSEEVHGCHRWIRRPKCWYWAILWDIRPSFGRESQVPCKHPRLSYHALPLYLHRLTYLLVYSRVGERWPRRYEGFLIATTKFVLFLATPKYLAKFIQLWWTKIQMIFLVYERFMTLVTIWLLFVLSSVTFELSCELYGAPFLWI